MFLVGLFMRLLLSALVSVLNSCVCECRLHNGGDKVERWHRECREKRGKKKERKCLAGGCSISKKKKEKEKKCIFNFKYWNLLVIVRVSGTALSQQVRYGIA